MAKVISTEKFKKRIQAMGFHSYIFIGVHHYDDLHPLEGGGSDTLIDCKDLERVHFEFREGLLKNDGENFEPLEVMVGALASAVEEARRLLALSKQTQARNN